MTEIIVLCHNAKEVTKKFLDLLFANTKSFHLTLIDNGSTEEGMVSYLNTFAENKNISLILNSENKGVIGGRNQGWEIVSNKSDCGEHICFLDNDQFVGEGWLEHHLSVLNNDYDLVGVEAWQLSHSFMPVHKAVTIRDWFSYVGCGGMLMKKQVPDKIGMFDPIFNPCYFEDPDFNFKALKEGFRIGWNAKARITHLPHQTLGNDTQRARKFIESYNKFRNKWRGTKPYTLRQRPLEEFK